MQKITAFLWFNDNAEEAIEFYTSIFKDSAVSAITRYDEATANATGRKPGSLMTASFKLLGQEFTALNGGPVFKFNEAISFVVNCKDQEEIDYYWEKLSEGGDESAQQCGWLKDKFGLSWQIIPAALSQLLKEPEKARRVMAKVMKMKKLVLQDLENA